jgi:protein-disulfide isomerase
MRSEGIRRPCRKRSTLISSAFIVAVVSASAFAVFLPALHAEQGQVDHPKATIAVADPFVAGNPKAPVMLAIYACPRNEACAKLVPELYREVTAGRLKDKVALVYRPFFSADDREAFECGRGLFAAAYQGQFWPYLLHLCLERERLTRVTLKDWVGSHGLDRCIFDVTCEKESAARWLAASRKEGLANGVKSAPSAFINGRLVRGKLDLEMLVNLLNHEHERLAQATSARERLEQTVPR